MNESAATAGEFDSPASSSVAEVCQRHNLSPTTIYREIREGRLRSFTVGASRRISIEAEREWIRRCEQQQYERVKATPKAPLTA